MHQCTSRCILHPDRVAITTAAQILVCQECWDKYAEEARKYLPEQERKFWLLLQRAKDYGLEDAQCDREKK